MGIDVMIVYFMGILFIGVSLFYYFSTKPVTIYNQSSPPSIDDLIDVKLYNHAVARLTLCYGLIFILEGILLNHEPLICLTIGVITIMPGIVIFCYMYERILKKYSR